MGNGGSSFASSGTVGLPAWPWWAATPLCIKAARRIVPGFVVTRVRGLSSCRVVLIGVLCGKFCTSGNVYSAPASCGLVELVEFFVPAAWRVESVFSKNSGTEVGADGFLFLPDAACGLGADSAVL